MDPIVQARELQRRARSLRRFAAMVEGAQLGALARQGGDDTWYGPTAAAFLEDCRAVDRLVDEAVDGLRRAAVRLDHEARELERLALATGPLTGA
jgi:hypothetical protein